jgi:hypothetical protein
LSTQTATIDFAQASARIRGGAATRRRTQTPSRAYYHRARAIAHATARDLKPAFAELGASWQLMGSVTADQAADQAWLYLLSGDLDSALGVLTVGTRGHERLTPRVRELLATCVELKPSLWKQGLAVAIGGGTVLDRMRAALGVLRARLTASHAEAGHAAPALERDAELFGKAA